MPHTAPMPRRAPGFRRAYTLIEVLVVVAILGIISAVVVPSMLTAGTMGVQAAARIIVADLLYAQNEAIAHQAPRGVVFDPDNETYRVVDANGDTIVADWMGGSSTGNYIVDFTKDPRFQGVTIESVNFNSTDTLTYNDLGSPSSGGSVSLRYNETAYRIDVSAFTGRVTVTAYVP